MPSCASQRPPSRLWVCRRGPPSGGGPRKSSTAFLSPVDVKLEPGLITQPDLLVVPTGELRKRSDFIQHLVLAAEVLSPSSARHDRVKKRPAYQRNRVSEYWIIDEQSRTVERWRPDDQRPEIVSEEFVWHPTGAREPLRLSLPDFFRDVLPEDESTD